VATAASEAAGRVLKKRPNTRRFGLQAELHLINIVIGGNRGSIVGRRPNFRSCRQVRGGPFGNGENSI
jgi:hypothetical protein